MMVIQNEIIINEVSCVASHVKRRRLKVESYAPEFRFHANAAAHPDDLQVIGAPGSVYLSRWEIWPQRDPRWFVWNLPCSRLASRKC